MIDFMEAFLILTLFSQIAFGAIVEVKFDDIPRLLKTQNKDVKAGELFIEASQKRTGHLLRSYLPTLKAEVGQENFQTGPSLSDTQPYGGVEAKINLFRGGKDLLEDKIRDAQVLSSQANAKKMYLNELTEARKNYWLLIYNREMIQILSDAKEENRKNLASAQKRIARGITGQTDKIEFELNESILKEEIESLRHENLIIQIGLSALFGLPQGTQLKTAESIPHDHDDALLATKGDGEAYFTTKLLKSNQEVSSLQRSINNRWWTPQVDIYATYLLHTQKEREYSSISDRDERTFGIRLTLELFDGFQAMNNASSFSLQSQAYEYQASQQKRNVEAQIEMTKEEMKHNHELIHEAEKRIEQGRLYLRRTSEEYNRGVKNSPDVLGASQKHISFRRRYAELRRDYQLAKTKLLALIGQ